MKSTAKTIALTLFKFAIPAAIITWLVWHLDWQTLATQPKDYPLLVAALLVAFIGLCISFARWCLLVRCQGIELSIIEAFRLSSICFLLSFVSAGSVGGDLFKAVFLARRRPGKRIEAVASVIVDRGVGLYGLVLIVAVALMLTHPESDVSSVTAEATTIEGIAKIKVATLFLVGIGTFVLAILVLGGKGVDRLIRQASEWPIVGNTIAKVGRPLRMFHSHPLAFLVSVIMSLFVHGSLAVSMWLIARGLYNNPPTLVENMVIVPIGMLASAIPIAPAGLGVYEAAIEWLYRIIPSQPMPKGSGTIVALVFEIVKIILAVIGTLFYWTAGREVRESLEEAEAETSEHSDSSENGF